MEWNIDVPDKTVDTDLAEFGKVTLPDCLDPSCPLIEKKKPKWHELTLKDFLSTC